MSSLVHIVSQKILWNRTWIFWVKACKVHKALRSLLSFVRKLKRLYHSSSNTRPSCMYFCFDSQVSELSGNLIALCNDLQYYLGRDLFHNQSLIQSSYLKDWVSGEFQAAQLKNSELNHSPWKYQDSKKFGCDVFKASVRLAGHQKLMLSLAETMTPL